MQNKYEIESKNLELNSYKVIFEVEEVGPIGGGIHTSIGNNDGSLVSRFRK